MPVTLLAVALALSPLAAAGGPPSRGPQTHPSVELPAEIDRVLRDYETAWRARDAASLTDLFTEDGFVLSSRRPPIRGREAIREHYEGHGGPLHLRALAWDRAGDVAYVIGGYRGRPEGPDDGKFTLTLRRQDDRWLIVSDMDNSNGTR